MEVTVRTTTIQQTVLNFNLCLIHWNHALILGWTQIQINSNCALNLSSMQYSIGALVDSVENLNSHF